MAPSLSFAQPAAVAAPEAAPAQGDRLLQVAAHDLRNPLAAIIASAVYMQKVAGDDVEGRRTRRHGALIQRSAERMASILSDVVDLAHAASSCLALEVEDHPVAVLVDAARGGAQECLDARELHLVVAMSDPSLPVRGDGTRLARLLTTLLRCAASLSLERGMMRLTTRAAGDRITLRVEVEGAPPIDREDLDRVFDPTWPNRHRAPWAVSGFELAVARALAQAHDGSLGLEQHDASTAFVLSLPLA